MSYTKHRGQGWGSKGQNFALFLAQNHREPLKEGRIDAEHTPRLGTEVKTPEQARPAVDIFLGPFLAIIAFCLIISIY